MQDAQKTFWSIPHVSVTFSSSLKQNFMAYRSSEVSSRPDCIFEIHQLWQSGFSRVYSSCCCSYSFEPEIIKIGQSSHKMYSNNILNFQESISILNAHTQKVRKLIECTTYVKPERGCFKLTQTAWFVFVLSFFFFFFFSFDHLGVYMSPKIWSSYFKAPSLC